MKGLGFLNLLTLAFVIGKVFGHFPYSWGIVFLPTIVSFAFGVLFLAFLFACYVAGKK